MYDFDRWHSENDRYLGESIAWLRSRLERLLASEDDPAADEIVSENVAQHESLEQLHQRLQLDPHYPPALEVLAERFELTHFEKLVVLLCAAVEFDTRVSQLCAAAQGDATKPFPTMAICFTLLPDAAWDAFSPERPLRDCRLLEVLRSHETPLTLGQLKIDERVTNYLKGLNYFDSRLAARCTGAYDDSEAVDLSPSQSRAVDSVLAHYDAAIDRDAPIPVVQLVGDQAAAKRLIAARLAEQLQLEFRESTTSLLPESLESLEEFTALWRRENRIAPTALLLDATTEPTPREIERLAWFAGRTTGAVLISVEKPLPRSLSWPAVDVERPSADEQRDAWRQLLPDHLTTAADRLAGQFDLELGSIREVATNWPSNSNEDAQESLWRACCRQTRPAFDGLAQRIDVRAGWDDIVLPAEQMETLTQLVGQVRRRGVVLDDWGFRRKMNRGLGMTALLAGESGTGKTTCAEILANELQLDLYTVNLSQVIDKYIGETEKNLKRLFDAADHGGCLVLLDEADALFGKRTDVKDSHDRFANIETNYLLQRLESYRGLAILATNNKAALDTAFLRRLRFTIDFPFPDAASRRLIWQRVFPDDAPLESLDFEHLAKLRLTGGNVFNIAVNAAYAAADAGHAIDMATILWAAEREMRKTDRPINAGDFQWMQRREAVA